jgi:hypothetical protein
LIFSRQFLSTTMKAEIKQNSNEILGSIRVGEGDSTLHVTLEREDLLDEDSMKRIAARVHKLEGEIWELVKISGDRKHPALECVRIQGTRIEMVSSFKNWFQKHTANSWDNLRAFLYTNRSQYVPMEGNSPGIQYLIPSQQ